MRITVDTNILVSATFWKGDSEKIIEKAEKKELYLVLSREIIDEYIRVLEYDEIKEKVSKSKLAMTLGVRKLLSIARIVEPKDKLDVVKEDPADNKIIECAKEGKAEFIITKDNHLLSIRKYEGIKIVEPERFLKILGSKQLKKFSKHSTLTEKEALELGGKVTRKVRERIRKGKLVTEEEARKRLGL